MPPKRIKNQPSTPSKKQKTTIDAKMDKLLDTVNTLGAKVLQIESKVNSSAATNTAQLDTTTTAEPSTMGHDVTMDDLRRIEPLQSRVDSVLSRSLPLQEEADPTPQPGPSSKLTKNPRLSSTKRITKHILWPHQFVHRPGVKDISFDELTLPEFVIGTCTIIQLPELSDTERNARTTHMRYLMQMSLIYPWQQVRSMYAAALEDLQSGLREWPDSLNPLKESMLHVPSAAKQQGSTQRISLCRLYNFGSCNYVACKYTHMCIPCYQSTKNLMPHPARQCPVQPTTVSPPAKNGK